MTASQQEYLKVIYILTLNSDKARVTDIAINLNCSKASVNNAIKILNNQGLLKYESYGDIELTEIGIKKAREIIKNHNTIKTFLINVLNINEEVAQEEARNIQYSASEDTINRFELYIQSVIDVNTLSCDYNPLNEKCQKCSNKRSKRRFDVNNIKNRNSKYKMKENK